MAIKKRNTIETASDEVTGAFMALALPMMALEQIGEGFQLVNRLPFTGHTLGVCINALTASIHGYVGHLNGHKISPASRKEIDRAMGLLQEYMKLANATFAYEDNVESPKAVGARLEALAIKAATHLNIAAWLLGVQPLDFSIGDYGLEEFRKQAA